MTTPQNSVVRFPQGVGLRGFGHSLPSRARANDDVAFAKIAADDPERRLFVGMEERSVLEPGEDIEPHMTAACHMALAQAGLRPDQIDGLYGYASISEYLVPNGLFRVHDELGLRGDIPVVPINAEFTTFITGIMLACDAIASGRCDHLLIACGSTWSRCADYTRGHALVAGDGAAAVVVGRSDRFRVLDYATATLSDRYDVMNLKIRSPVPQEGVSPSVVPPPTFQITDRGRETFLGPAHEIPPALMRELAGRNGVSAASLTMVTHESSNRLTDAWEERIAPGQYLRTFQQHGDIPLVSIMLTLSLHHTAITGTHLGLLSPGPGTHYSAMLLQC